MKRILRGHSLVEVLIAVLVLSLAGICYLALGTSEVQRAGAVRDRACAEDMCWNLICVVEPLGGAFLERTAPDGDGQIVFDDLSSLAWFPSIHMRGPLQKWAREKNAAVGLTFQPCPTVPPKGKNVAIGTLTCTVSWKDSKGNARTKHVKRIIRR